MVQRIESLCVVGMHLPVTNACPCFGGEGRCVCGAEGGVLTRCSPQSFDHCPLSPFETEQLEGGGSSFRFDRMHPERERENAATPYQMYREVGDTKLVSGPFILGATRLFIAVYLYSTACVVVSVYMWY